MTQPHYLRFARALTLAALVPGCTGTGAPAPAPSPITASDAGLSGPSDAAVVADASAENDEVDAYAFSSGPIVPPELPAGCA
jgi:hypothetical protein